MLYFPLQANRQAPAAQIRPRKLRETERILCGRYKRLYFGLLRFVRVHWCTLFIHCPIVVPHVVPQLCGDSKMEDFSRDPTTQAIRSSCSRISRVHTSPTGLCLPAHGRYVTFRFLPRQSPLWRHLAVYIYGTVTISVAPRALQKLRHIPSEWPLEHPQVPLFADCRFFTQPSRDVFFPTG